MAWSPIIVSFYSTRRCCSLPPLPFWCGSIFTTKKTGKASIFAFGCMKNLIRQYWPVCSPFQFWWWTWLALTGAGLGLTVSCKWVGLFTIATIGCSTIKGLLDIWANVRIPMHEFLRHFMARAVCLIILPVAIYMLMFEIHFISLPNSGEGDGFMSPEFQQTLSGHVTMDSPIDIAYGSKVYIRHIETHGGYLHSHPHNYPTGSKR